MIILVKHFTIKESARFILKKYLGKFHPDYSQKTNMFIFKKTGKH